MSNFGHKPKGKQTPSKEDVFLGAGSSLWFQKNLKEELFLNLSDDTSARTLLAWLSTKFEQ